MTAFKAYDIRGIYGEALTRDMVYRVGRFLPGLLDADRVLVGRDARASSPEVFDALARGLTEQGADGVTESRTAHHGSDSDTHGLPICATNSVI